ncbi:peptidylprolyl isomerase [Erythrobacter sp. SG61-1L]|uniref:peptidylprolyl isomerase n=1 Tax=Erythrobacter sp. SG61-1L TaxID=1603897 RepID=UPI0009E7FA38|nr:peptidylprolyl isomerase [Erythrobacter sp. SG61-1L]
MAALVAGTALAGVTALHAQSETADSSDPFNLPSSITLLGKEDPNLRKATAVVNGFVITGTDIDQRVALILDANKQEVSAEEHQRLKLQVLRNLIDETLQIQEAKALEIEVSKAEVDQTYERVATQNFGQSKTELDTYLKKIGSSPGSLKRQIEGELAWQRIQQRNIQPFISVSEEEVNELLDRLKAAKGTEEYRIGEIYLPATAENEQAVAENGRKIMDQLQQGGSFVAYARQFSQASSAAVGGDLGWIRLPLLPAELASAARQMQPGQLVGPVKVPGGFSLLYLIDKRQVLTADPRDATLSLKQISISFPAGTSEADAEPKISQFNAGVARMRGCGDAESVAKEIGADVVSNDQIAARALPEALQDILLKLSVGQSTPPFGSVQDGVRVLMLCGRDDPEVDSGPTFQQLMNQLEDDRISKRAQRYLRDLRRDAIIEYN